MVRVQHAFDSHAEEARGGITRYVGELLARYLFNDDALNVLTANAFMQFTHPLEGGETVNVLMFLKWGSSWQIARQYNKFCFGAVRLLRTSACSARTLLRCHRDVPTTHITASTSHTPSSRTSTCIRMQAS